MTLRRNNNPKRCIAPPDRLDRAGRELLAEQVTYTGSAIHKRHPGDYGFQPPVNPRPWKSLCDGKRSILRAEAGELLRQGVTHGFFSNFPDNGRPKHIWAVDGHGEAYEAKLDNNGYHGYRLEEEDDLRPLLLKEWAKRCRPL